MTNIRRIERMANGFWRIDSTSGLVGVYSADGTKRSGQLRYSPAQVLALVAGR